MLIDIHRHMNKHTVSREDKMLERGKKKLPRLGLELVVYSQGPGNKTIFMA